MARPLSAAAIRANITYLERYAAAFEEFCKYQSRRDIFLTELEFGRSDRARGIVDILQDMAVNMLFEQQSKFERMRDEVAKKRPARKRSRLREQNQRCMTAHGGFWPLTTP